MAMKRAVVPKMNTGLSQPLRPVAASGTDESSVSSALRPMATASSLGRAISTSTGLGGDEVADADMIMRMAEDDTMLG